jgi:ATP-dependent DNA helicase RecQ
MSAVLRTGETFGNNHIVDIIRGANNQKIRNFSHDKIKTYGAGKDISKKDWNLIVENLFTLEAIVQRKDENGQIELTKKGRDILFGRQSFNIIEAVKVTKKSTQKPTNDEKEYNNELFQELRDLRTNIARKGNVPPYVVFSDKTLREMATKCPTSRGAMLQITGVGQMKMRKYGEIFTRVIKAFTAN